MNEEIPQGFKTRDRRSPLTDPWEPIYQRINEKSVDLGLWLKEAHCNARGMAHGGLLTALADNAMGHSCARVLGKRGGLVTVNLSADFLGTAYPGSWLQISSVVDKVGKNLCFVQCKITADDVVCARACNFQGFIRKQLSASICISLSRNILIDC